MGKDKDVLKEVVSGPLRQIEKTKRCMRRTRNCAVGWMITSILLFIIGILVLVFFSKYISKDVWQKGLGITGVVFLLLGILGIVVGISMICLFLHLLKRQEQSMSGGKMHDAKNFHKKPYSKDLYPRQPGYEDFVNPPGDDKTVVPPPTDQGAVVNPDAIVVDTNEKF